MDQLLSVLSSGQFKWQGIWHVVHRRKDKVLWEAELTPNILHNEGEAAILSAYFDLDFADPSGKGASYYGAAPSNLYIGLDARGSLAETDVLPVTGEPTTTGYARQAVSTTSGWTMAKDSGDWKATSSTETFGPSAGYNFPEVDNAFLCSVASGNSGLLIASVALSQARTVLDGESLDVTIGIKLSE